MFHSPHSRGGHEDGGRRCARCGRHSLHGATALTRDDHPRGTALPGHPRIDGAPPRVLAVALPLLLVVRLCARLRG
jgi:hypothetical protein